MGRGTYGYEALTTTFGWMVKRIGRYCSISVTAQIPFNHPVNYVTTSGLLYAVAGIPPRENMWSVVEKWGEPSVYHPFSEEELVEIGNDVWIGANVVLMPGVKIGDGAILGAGAVVTKNVEPYAIVGGVPARLIRYRYPQEMREAFLRIKWWDWPLEKIEENLELFYQPELFCKRFDKENSK